MHGKYIELVCSHCQGKFLKENKEYRRKQRLKKDKFYCSVPCSNMSCVDEFSPFRTFLILCKKNVRKKKFDFNLDLPYLKLLWEKQRGICPYSKISMLLSQTSNGKEFKPSTASLDRIDSNKGYVKGNVEFVCLAINYAKNKFEHNDFSSFINNMRNLSGS